MSANGMQRVGALTLSDIAYGGLYSATIDPTNGYAYFGGKSGWVVKLNIKGALPVEVGATQCPSGQAATALIDVAAGYAYFFSSRIDRVALGAGDNPPAYVDTLVLSGFAFSGVIDTSDPDPAKHYAYLEIAGTPHRVAKIALSTLTEVGSTPLNPDETSFRRAVIDSQNGYAYFVGPVTEAAPPKVVKIKLGSGGTQPVRIGAAQLDTVWHGMGSAVIDVARGYGYFGTYYGPNSVPATVYKVALGAADAAPSLVGQVSLSAGTGAANGPDAAERELCAGVIDPGSGYAYFGTDHTYPAKIFQIGLGSGDAPPAETGLLQLAGGTQPIGEPNGPDDGENVINRPSSSYGEVFLQSAVLDPVRGYAYFGIDGYPGKIVKMMLAPPPGAAGGTPDALISLAATNTFAGDGIYNTTGAGQRRSAAVAIGGKQSFLVRIQNDGSVVDRFALRGCADSPGFAVRYFDGSGMDVTSAVEAGTYDTGLLEPGAETTIRLKIVVKSSALPGSAKACKVLATSLGSAAAKDAVKAKVSVF